MVQWHKFDYEDKSNTPEPYETVWVIEEYYALGVTQGYFDGYTFNTFESKDDCKVSYWAQIEYPDPPEEWSIELQAAYEEDEEDDDEL